MNTWAHVVAARAIASSDHRRAVPMESTDMSPSSQSVSRY
jgi:hypothetical protein